MAVVLALLAQTFTLATISLMLAAEVLIPVSSGAAATAALALASAASANPLIPAMFTNARVIFSSIVALSEAAWASSAAEIAASSSLFSARALEIEALISTVAALGSESL